MDVTPTDVSPHTLTCQSPTPNRYHPSIDAAPPMHVTPTPCSARQPNVQFPVFWQQKTSFLVMHLFKTSTHKWSVSHTKKFWSCFCAKVVVGMTGRGVMGIVKAIAPNMAVFMVFDILQNVFHAVSFSKTSNHCRATLQNVVSREVLLNASSFDLFPKASLLVARDSLDAPKFASFPVSWLLQMFFEC